MRLFYNEIMPILLYLYILIIISILTFAFNTIDMDYWARLLQGDAFFQLGHILKQDIFSYVDVHQWIDHEWGSSIILSFVQRNFGFAGILFLRILIIFLIYVFIIKTIKLRCSIDSKFSFIILFLISICCMPSLIHSGLRCHFFTFLFFTIFIYILEKVRLDNNNKLLFMLPVLMLFWVNIHGGCVSGLGLLFMYSLGEALNKNEFKKYILTLILCLLVMFINPYGVEYVKFIFMATTMPRPFVTEWISPFLHPSITFLWEFKIYLAISLISYIYILKRKKIDYTQLILILVCTYLSCKYTKNVPFYVIVSMIFLYGNICNNKLNKLHSSLTVIICIISVLVSIKVFISNSNLSFISQQPVKIVEFLKINNLKGNVLAPFDMGSYIIYKLYPNNLVYMDGRYEEVYFKETKELLDNFYNVSNDWKKILNSKYKHDFIIVPKDALLNDYLREIKNYKIIYVDETNILYSHIDNLRNIYKLPNQKYSYYEFTAFIPNFQYKNVCSKI